MLSYQYMAIMNDADDMLYWIVQKIPAGKPLHMEVWRAKRMCAALRQTWGHQYAYQSGKWMLSDVYALCDTYTRVLDHQHHARLRVCPIGGSVSFTKRWQLSCCWRGPWMLISSIFLSLLSRLCGRALPHGLCSGSCLCPWAVCNVTCLRVARLCLHA